MKKKILIIGSNFALNYHLKIIYEIYKNSEVHIVSPNIYKKKINNKIIKHVDFKKVLNKYTFNFILCCATPNVQTNFIKYIFSNKIKIKNILLEKPVSLNLRILNEFLKYSKKNKINLAFNFTYSNLKIINRIKKITVNNSKEYELSFSLNFMHPFFLKKNKSWKNFISNGGGIINYYLNHILFSLIKIFGELKIKSLKIISNKKNQLIKLKLNLLNKKININMNINMFSKLNIHKYELYHKKDKKIFLTKKKNWYLEYEYYDNKKKYLYKENIINLIKLNYTYLKKKKFINSKYLNEIYLNEELCHKLNKKLKNYDFKKM